MIKTQNLLDQQSTQKGGELQNTPNKVGKELPKRQFKPLMFLLKTLLGITLLGLVCIGVLAYVLSRGAISNDHITAQIESSVSQAIGAGISVKFDDAKLAIGKGGFIAIDVENAKLLRDQSINLGTVDSIALTLEALPLMRGDVKAKSLFMDGANIALLPYLPALEEDTERLTPWPEYFDLAPVMKALGNTFAQLGGSLSKSGLKSVVLTNARLSDFDHLGMKAKNGRIAELRLEVVDGGSEQFSFSLNIELDDKNWEIKGDWRLDQSDDPILTAVVEGVSFSDFPNIHIKQNDYLALTGQLNLSMSIPFSTDGIPKQSVYRIEIGETEAYFKNEMVSKIVGAELNFRYFPEENQLEMERSPIRFQTTEFSLVGGIKYPVGAGNEAENKPVFQLLTENLSAFSDTEGADGVEATGEILGWVDTQNRTLVGSSLILKTGTGDLKGEGAISFATRKPSFKAEFSIEDISLPSIKRFWPVLIAKDLRKWTIKNVTGGQISKANLSIDFPPGMLGNAPEYAPENISGTIDVFDAEMRTIGDLPSLKNAKAKVSVAGTRTLVELHSGKIDLGEQGSLTVEDSQVKIGSYTQKHIDTTMSLKVLGNARSMIHLGTLKPLAYTKSLNLNPKDCIGDVTANVKLDFGLKQVAKQGVDKWSANVRLVNGAHKKPIGGYEISKANLIIDATKGVAKVNGAVNVNGFPANVALIEVEKNPAKSTRKVIMTLDDAGRERFGAGTGDVVIGPIVVTMNISPSGKTNVSANLKNATLNLSWVGWTKGKSIPATASFDLVRKSNDTMLQNFVLKGRGFSARGTFNLDSKGLRSANLKKIKLNETDDFDVVASRTKHGFDIKFNARSYDGRALIQYLVQSGIQTSKEKFAVTFDGRIEKFIGFGGQHLTNTNMSLVHNGDHIERLHGKGMAMGTAPTSISLLPDEKGAKIDLTTTNAGSVLRFLDLYTKMRGGTVDVSLVRDKSQVYRGLAVGKKFTLLGEPRLAALLQKPQTPAYFDNHVEIVSALKKLRTDTAKVDNLQADVIVSKGVFNVEKGRLSGGNASAEFSGQIYDSHNKMKIRGTYLPGRSLNKLVSKIPILGLALGGGKVSGLLGITFSLSGPYRNPRLQVNPLSIITPGVFRQIFRQ